MINFTTRALKSYTAREAAIAGGVSCEPSIVVVKSFPTKAPKAEVQVYTTYFSEMRGTSSANGPKVTLTDTAAVALCREFVADRAGKSADVLLVLADRLDELAATAEKSATALASVARKLRRFHLLGGVESAYWFVRTERREKAYADCRFKVGDMVRWRNSDAPAEVVSVRFDEHNLEWRVGITAVDAPQHHFAHAEALATA